jgi:hypothetical protein
VFACYENIAYIMLITITSMFASNANKAFGLSDDFSFILAIHPYDW